MYKRQSIESGSDKSNPDFFYAEGSQSGSGRRVSGHLPRASLWIHTVTEQNDANETSQKTLAAIPEEHPDSSAGQDLEQTEASSAIAGQEGDVGVNSSQVAGDSDYESIELPMP